MREQVAQKLSASVEAELTRNGVPAGFPALPEIPGGRYTSPEFYDLEMKYLWRQSWLCAGRAEEVPDVGSYKVWERAGAIALIVRSRDGQIRAFHNTCRHRGAPLVREDKGRVNLLVCGYHAWAYDLEGNLIRVPEEEDFNGLDKCSRGLLPIRAETWGGWIFLNFDMNAKPLLDSLGQLVEDFAPFRMDNLRIAGRMHYKVACNWKAAMDAFLEAYHVKCIHQQTVAQLLDAKGTSIAMFTGGHTRMALYKKYNRGGGTWGTEYDGFDIPGTPQVFRENNVAYGVFPNFVTPTDSGGFPFIMFWPTGIDTCECEMIFVGHGNDSAPDNDPSGYWTMMLENYDKIQTEDFQFLAGIQKSLNSGAFTGMVLSYQERRIYWMHEEFDRRIGIERIPPELRVQQLLTPFVES